MHPFAVFRLTPYQIPSKRSFLLKHSLRLRGVPTSQTEPSPLEIESHAQKLTVGCLARYPFLDGFKGQPKGTPFFWGSPILTPHPVNGSKHR